MGMLVLLVGLLMLAWDDSGDSGLELDSDLMSNACENSWKLLLVVGSECETDGALVMGRGRLSRFAFSLGEVVNNLLFTSVSSNSELDVNLSSPAAAALDADRYRLPRLLSSKDTRNFSGRAEKLSGETNLGLENFGRGRATVGDGEAPPLEASLPDDLPSPAPADSSPSLFSLLAEAVGLTLLLYTAGRQYPKLLPPCPWKYDPEGASLGFEGAELVKGDDRCLVSLGLGGGGGLTPLLGLELELELEADEEEGGGGSAL